MFWYTYIKTVTLSILALSMMACQSNHFSVREVRALEGWNEARLVRKYGRPERVGMETVAQFARSPEPWRPLTQKVLSMYPTNNPPNVRVGIKSLSWTHGRIMLTAWLHPKPGDWVSFHVEEWNMDYIE